MLCSVTPPPPQPFYSPFSGTTRVSRCQKRTSGLYGARGDLQRQTHRPSGWAPLNLANWCPPPPSPKFFYGPDALPGAQTTVSKRQLIYHDYNCSTDKIQAIALFTVTKILWQWQCKDTNYNQCLMYLDLPTPLWPQCMADADIIFLSCFFLLVFSSPNLSGRRLDVYHTSTHSVS